MKTIKELEVEIEGLQWRLQTLKNVLELIEKMQEEGCSEVVDAEELKSRITGD